MNRPSCSTKKSCNSISIVDEEWEYLDPTPDIHSLFLQFNDTFFWGKLKAVVVKWSPRMTLCAGLCRYEGRGGLCSISLSVPLLKLRPRKDLVETLLHEMIHAYLFVTENNRDREGHGPQFQYHMNRINQETGAKITIYHSFHDEVRLYKQHWWKCDGPCQNRRPFYGLVKRSMNRAPGPNDFWWAEHKATCGGMFTKIKEPENYGVKKKRAENENNKTPKKSKTGATSGGQDIRNFFSDAAIGSPIPSVSSAIPKGSSGTMERVGGKTISGSGGMLSNKGSSTVIVKSFSDHTLQNEASGSSASNTHGGKISSIKDFVPFQGEGHVLGNAKSSTIVTIDLSDSRDYGKYVSCPVCSTSVHEDIINQHLDSCLQ